MQTELQNIACGTLTFHDNGFKSQVAALLAVYDDDQGKLVVQFGEIDQREQDTLIFKSADEAIEAIQAKCNHLIVETPPPWRAWKIDWQIDGRSKAEVDFKRAVEKARNRQT